jgi:probable phosphoglycerate mutase
MEQQQIFLIRHGETEWSRDGRHTGRTDIPLTAAGKLAAEAIGRALQGRPLRVWTSPLARARETCRLAGYAEGAEPDNDLLEWNYGIYEGRTTLDIRRETPEWSVWLSPIVDGESLEEVAERTRRVIGRVTQAEGDAALFAHAHVLRILAACWMGLAPYTGRFLALDTATISVLGYERRTRVIRRWNLPPGE